jgi:hypothetical protein
VSQVYFVFVFDLICICRSSWRARYTCVSVSLTSSWAPQRPVTPREATTRGLNARAREPEQEHAAPGQDGGADHFVAFQHAPQVHRSAWRVRRALSCVIFARAAHPSCQISLARLAALCLSFAATAADSMNSRKLLRDGSALHDVYLALDDARRASAEARRAQLAEAGHEEQVLKFGASRWCWWWWLWWRWWCLCVVLCGCVCVCVCLFVVVCVGRCVGG